MARSTVWFLSAALRISSGSSRSPRRDPSLNAIEREFDSQLQGLLESFEEDSSSPLNLQWLQQALTVVHSVNSAVEALVPSVSLPVSDRDDKWFQDYLDDNSKLLDACNYIKETIEQVCSYQLLVTDVVRSLESHDSYKYQRARNALKECRRRDDTNKSKLESCSSILRRTGDRIGSPVASGFLSATHGSKLLTVFICGVLAACMCFKPKRGLCTLHCSSSYLWSSSMLSLQQRVKEEVERHKHTGSASRLSELARLDLCLGKLQELSPNSLSDTDLEDELGRLCAELHDLGEEIETGLKTVHHQVNEVFRVLVATRVALLDLFSHPRNFSS